MSRDLNKLQDQLLNTLKIHGNDEEKCNEVDDDQDCRTPTSAGHKIPNMSVCPPAPKKGRIMTSQSCTTNPWNCSFSSL